MFFISFRVDIILVVEELFFFLEFEKLIDKESQRKGNIIVLEISLCFYSLMLYSLEFINIVILFNLLFCVYDIEMQLLLGIDLDFFEIVGVYD